MTKASQRRVAPFPNVDGVALALFDTYGDPAHGNKMNPLRELLFIVCSLSTNEALYQSTLRSSLLRREPNHD